jgi:hypothetical protein
MHSGELDWRVVPVVVGVVDAVELTDEVGLVDPKQITTTVHQPVSHQKPKFGSLGAEKCPLSRAQVRESVMMRATSCAPTLVDIDTRRA